MFRSKAFIVFTHLLSWLIFISLPLLFLNQQSEQEQFNRVIRTSEYWLFYGIYIALFYLHGNLLLPYLFIRKRYIAYVGIIIILFTAVYYLRPFDNLIARVSRVSERKPEFRPPPDSNMPPPADRQLPPPPFRPG